jgi:hypothetical protein
MISNILLAVPAVSQTLCLTPFRYLLDKLDSVVHG